MKRLCCLLIALSMIIILALPASAQESTVGVVASNVDNLAETDYAIAFDVTYVWDDCYAATISIQNLCGKNIGDWELHFNLDSKIETIENAQIRETYDNKYVITSKSYSKVILPDETLIIGLLITGSNEVVPEEFILSGIYQEYEVTDVTVIENSSLYNVGDFYVVQGEITSLSGYLENVDNTYNGHYVVEDEYGNVLDNGNVEFDGTWEIDGIGFGVGFNHVTITGNTDGCSIYASFDVVNFDLSNSENIGIDVNTDTDGDGICNYLEINLGIDPYNANSIDKEKTDCESIVDIIGLDPIENETEAVVIEEECESQSADGEAEPYATSITSMVIHRTKHPEGSKSLTSDSTKYIADDLTFNDYSYSELCALGSVFSVANVTAESLMWSEMAAIFAAAKRIGSSMNDVLDDLVDTFRNGNNSNEGTSVEVGDIYSSSKYIKYSNTTLTNAVKADDATLAYTDLIKDFVVGFLCDGRDPSLLKYTIGGNLNLIEAYVYSFDNTPYPSYGGATALGISIHGWHGHTITLQNYRETATGFTATLKFHFYDHFGLDSDDEITAVGFCDWFTLQHYTKFDGKYVPFLTYCDISYTISGTF